MCKVMYAFRKTYKLFILFVLILLYYIINNSRVKFLNNFQKFKVLNHYSDIEYQTRNRMFFPIFYRARNKLIFSYQYSSIKFDSMGKKFIRFLAYNIII